MTPTLAHIGHWYVSALYVAPLVVVVVALKVRDYRERHPKSEPPEPGGEGGEE